MGGSSSTTNQNQQQVSTPTIPNYALGPVQNLYGGISNYQNSDPYSFVTPMNGLQQQAYSAASGLGQSGQTYGQAAQGAQSAMNAPANTASLASLNPAAQAGWTGYTAPTLGNPAQANAASLDPAGQANAVNTGPAAQTTAASPGSAQAVNLGGYNTANLGNAAQAGAVNLNPNASQATAQSLLTNFQDYQNPATQGLVDATLANYDHQNELARGNLVADAARNRAFGGSRYALQQAGFDADSQRNRALTEAELRNQAFLNAANLATTDAGFRQQAGLFNTQAQNQRAETLGALNAANNQFNANQANQYGLARFDAQNQANRYGADAANQGSLFNANAANDFALTDAGFRQQANLANTAAANDFTQANANRAQQTGLFNTQAANDFSLANAGYQQQANLANTGAQNQFSLAGADLAAQAGQFGANAQNVAALTNAGAQNQYGLAQFNAANTMNQFNAAQGDNALQRQLQAAGLLGNIAGASADTYRADLGTGLDLGNSLWNLQNQYTQAPLTQLQNTTALLNPSLLSPISQQTVTGQSSGQTQQSGGLFNTLLGVGSLAAPFISDRHAKTDITRVGQTDGGLPVYTFRYKDGGPVQMGVMAQDVEAMQPEALGPTIGGYKSVYYAEVR